jgi:hypothetical protein
LLATHKPVLEKLKKELKASFNHEDEITFVNVQKLDYIMAVIREGLRIYPPVPSALPRRAPPGGITINERYVPPNVNAPHLSRFFYLSVFDFVLAFLQSFTNGCYCFLDCAWNLAVADVP